MRTEDQCKACSFTRRLWRCLWITWWFNCWFFSRFLIFSLNWTSLSISRWLLNLEFLSVAIRYGWLSCLWFIFLVLKLPISFALFLKIIFQYFLVLSVGDIPGISFRKSPCLNVINARCLDIRRLIFTRGLYRSFSRASWKWRWRFLFMEKGWT